MRILFFLALFTTAVYSRLSAQQVCASYDYLQNELSESPALQQQISETEQFIQRQLQDPTRIFRKGDGFGIITIPVVVHILYHQQSENISDQQVYEQIEVLNKCFRRLNADTVNTPEWFKPVAADCEIEFKLAVTDPRKRSTTGIVRTYTPVEKWTTDDQMKFTLKGGDDAWDAENYLNIWVCTLNRTLGYASFPGGPADIDGVVINFSAFGISGSSLGKTVVHEVGHWLGLRHTWGDAYCGDDWVDDTPKQSTFTNGCPSGIRISCSNAPNGDMYMNYMDITSDICTNIFTEGQKERMRAVFQPGGPRAAILTSYGLQPPLISEIPIPDEGPKWFYPNLYPNPATEEVTLDLSYDIRWMGKTITIFNAQGQTMMKTLIDSKIIKINISRLIPGVYFLYTKKEDGATIKQRLVKL